MASRQFVKKISRMSAQLAIDEPSLNEFSLLRPRLDSHPTDPIVPERRHERRNDSERIAWERKHPLRVRLQGHRTRKSNSRQKNRGEVAAIDGCARTLSMPGTIGRNGSFERSCSSLVPGLLLVAYFLWRCRLKSFRCLCLRIFLRRFLITLPNGILPLWRLPRPRIERAKV